MTPSLIHKALSTLSAHRVSYLLMGGQACVLHGATEFSRDVDIALLAEPENAERLEHALADLRAERIAVPPLSLEYLKRGHAVHFRCKHPEADGLRIDVMSVMRGVDPFDELWKRRVTLRLDGDLQVDLMSVPDLVHAKKTQRDKDWPMIRRLIEADYARHRPAATPDRIAFWCREARTPEILVEIARQHPALLAGLRDSRPLLSLAESGDIDGLREALLEEQERERRLDRDYWRPLREELERLRHAR